ncbi:cytochrome P450, partial [Streptacidiphilus monticola]
MSRPESTLENQTSPQPPTTLVPPPGCPAHGAGQAGEFTPLYGGEAETDSERLYEELRKRYGAVAPVLAPGGVPAWLVLSYHAITEVLRAPSRFTSDPRVSNRPLEPTHPLAPIAMWQPLINFADGPEHLRLREAENTTLGQLNRRGMRRYVERETDHLIDLVCADGHADLVADYAEQLPMRVLTRLFGLADSGGAELAAACRDLLKGSETALQSNAKVVAILTELVRDRAENPRQDIPSWLLNQLTPDEVVQHLRHMLVAGNETTTNLITDTIRFILSDSRAHGRLSGGHMTLPDAIEHVLWNNPPLRVLPARYALQDTTLGEGETRTQIRKGDMLLLGLAAGNTDPAIRPDLEESMVGNRSHLSFGAGPHSCPGADLGRAIAETAIDRLLTRLPDVRLTVAPAELKADSTWMARHVSALPVEFTPTAPNSEPRRATP